MLEFMNHWYCIVIIYIVSVLMEGKAEKYARKFIAANRNYKKNDMTYKKDYMLLVFVFGVLSMLCKTFFVQWILFQFGFVFGYWHAFVLCFLVSHVVFSNVILCHKVTEILNRKDYNLDE